MCSVLTVALCCNSRSSYFASEEAEVVGDEVPSSGVTTGSRACHSTLLSPLRGPDHLLTCRELALCRRPWVYMMAKV